MSKKPVKILKKRTIDKLFADYSRSEWAEALGVSPAAFDKWLQRERIPIDKYSEAVLLRKAINGGLKGKPLLEILASDTLKILSLESSLTEKSKLNPYHHHKVQNKSSSDVSEGSQEHSIDLSKVPVDQLVDEIEVRGWDVSLTRKKGA